jgi:hypothetical protein
MHIFCRQRKTLSDVKKRIIAELMLHFPELMPLREAGTYFWQSVSIGKWGLRGMQVSTQVIGY